MHPLASQRLVLACAALIGCTPLMAQTAPPIKTGLWQLKHDRQVDGKAAPDMSEQLAKMPPEARQQMEAMLKQRGVDISAGIGNLKLCLSRESLDTGEWQRQQGQCKTDYLSRTSSAWKWHTVCTQPAAVSDGESHFIDPENYTVDSATRMTVNGSQQTTTMKLTGKWLGADCGDVKPLSAKPAS